MFLKNYKQEGLSK